MGVKKYIIVMKQSEQEQEPITHIATKSVEKNLHFFLKNNKKKVHKIIFFFFVIVFCGVAAFAGNYIAYNITSKSSDLINNAKYDGNKITTSDESSIMGVVKKAEPSVVSITTKSQSLSFYGATTEEDAGTGIVLSKNGYILTNYHVIENFSSIKIITSDGITYDSVKYIGRDPLNDIAFLKIENVNNLTPIEIGNSSTLNIGQKVVAIGNALGQYQNTVTSGIVSGTGRPVTASSSDGNSSETLTDLLQTDAAINSGNSGGPLVNMSGQIVGVNTAVAQNANGIGFSIPINSEKGLIKSVIETGKINKAYLGVSYLDITAEVANEYKLSQKNGAYVTPRDASSNNAVVSGSPADKAGIKSEDIITKVNDDTIGKQGSLSTLIGEHMPDDKVRLTIVRDNKTTTIDVVLGSYQPATNLNN